MTVEGVICKENHNIAYLSGDSVNILSSGQTLTSAISSIHDQINILNRQIKRSKSFAWRHSRRKRRRYW